MSDKNKARNALLGSLAVGGLTAGGVYAQEKLKDAIMSLIFEDINKGYKTSWFERNFGTGEHKGITTKDK